MSIMNNYVPGKLEQYVVALVLNIKRRSPAAQGKHIVEGGRHVLVVRVSLSDAHLVPLLLYSALFCLLQL